MKSRELWKKQLMHEAEQGLANALSLTLETAPAGAVDWVDAHGFTPLMHACTEGHAAVVRLLCEAGATLDLCNPQSETALHLASSIGYTDVVHLLVEHGANPGLRTASGVTATELATQLGHESLAAFLSDGRVSGVTPASLSSEAASAQPDARDAAYALLDADLAPLSHEALSEVEAVLQLTLERIAQFKATPPHTTATGATAKQAPGQRLDSPAATISSTKNAAALARARLASTTPPEARPLAAAPAPC